MIKSLTAIALAATFVAGAANAVTTVTYEAPGVENTTLVIPGKKVETFSSAPYGSVFGGTYSPSIVVPADVFGGAGGTGSYLKVQSKVTTLTLGSTYGYFGLYASALDGANTVSFYKLGSLVDSFNLTALTAAFPAAYKGNPDLGGNSKQVYAFVNFAVVGGYDQVLFTRGGGGGFESDNHTVGLALVPEPATWAMMVAGFGLVGFGLRRRSKSVVLA